MKPAHNNGLLSMPPNSHPANPTHGGTAASQTLGETRKVKLIVFKFVAFA
jgi:hypothetical protein